MDVTIFNHARDAEPTVKRYIKDPEAHEDFDLWIVQIREGGNNVAVLFRDYDDLHTFATKLMVEAASARP